MIHTVADMHNPAESTAAEVWTEHRGSVCCLRQQSEEPAFRAAELTMGRTFAVHFDHGEDLYPALAEFCAEYGVRQGFIPIFIAGLRKVQLVARWVSVSRQRPVLRTFAPQVQEVVDLVVRAEVAGVVGLSAVLQLGE